MIPEDIYLKIVRSAIKAPSGHNTQSWTFKKEKDSICISPDFSRCLPVADPNNRELFISQGCAAENAIISSKFYGYNAVFSINDKHTPCTIKIQLKEVEKAADSELFSSINFRQTTRNLYSDTPIPEEDLVLLKESAIESGIDIRLFIGPAEIEKLTPYIVEANAIQFNNSDFKHELIQWIRFSEKEALHKGDGLYAPCIGLPSIGRVAGNIVIKYFVTAKSEEKKLLKQLDKTATMAMFTTKKDDIEHWIRLGMSFQRFALTATMLNIKLAHLNMPCQVQSVKEKMMTEQGLESTIPQLLIRLGYSKAMPYSLRRNIINFLRDPSRLINS